MLLQALFLALALLSTGNDLSGSDPLVQTLGPYGGDVRSLAVHVAKPERFFLGTSDGMIFVSPDAGSSWRKLVPGLARRDVVIDNLVFHPSDPDTLYAACWELRNNRGWLFRTRDAGQTWEDLSPQRFSSPIRAIAISPSDPKAIALGISEGVLLSVDEGVTWDRITRGYRDLYNVESLAFDPLDSQTLYVGTWRLGWKTTNRGRNWQAIHQGMYFDSDMFSLLVNPLNPEKLFASACTGIYRSLNAGAKWTKLNNGLPKDARRTRTLQFDPSDPEVVYAGTTAGLFVSRDGGTSWRMLINDIVVNAVAVQPGRPDTILVGSDDAGILKSVDGGSTFAVSNEGFIHRQISALVQGPSENSLYAAVPQDGSWGGFFLSDDGGGSWRPYNDGLGAEVGSIRSILPSRSGRVYLSTAAGLFAGVPGQDAWTPLKGGKDTSFIDMVFQDRDEKALLLSSSKGLFRFDLESDRLQAVKLPVYEGQINGLYRDSETGFLFAAGEIGVFRSKDGGQSWETKVKGLPPIPVNVVQGAGRDLYAGTRNGLYVSRDGGESWSLCRSVYPLDIITLTANPMRSSEVFAAESAGGFLFRTEDGGDSWTPIAPQNRSRVARMIYTTSGKLLAGTLSEGVYRLDHASSGETKASGR